jgi:hypothetical protein
VFIVLHNNTRGAETWLGKQRGHLYLGVAFMCGKLMLHSYQLRTFMAQTLSEKEQKMILM